MCVCAREQGLSDIDCCLHVHVCARLSAGVRVRVRVALGCVDALQSSGIVPIVEKVRGLIKNVWSPDISHQQQPLGMARALKALLQWVGGCTVVVVVVCMYTSICVHFHTVIIYCGGC